MPKTGVHDLANSDWCVAGEDKRSARSNGHAQLAVLMDIRTSLHVIEDRLTLLSQTLPGRLQSVENRLRRISANTYKAKRRRKKTTV